MERQREDKSAIVQERLLLTRVCERNGIILTQQQVSALSAFAERVLSWNSKINLLSRADSENIWKSHILHSLAPLFVVDIPKGIRILDLGSGGGFPGIPLSIVRNDLQITLLDSIRKKSVALQDMVDGLGLPNVRIKLGRAEEFAASTERFDIVIARAVAPLIELIKWSRPLLVTRQERTNDATNPDRLKRKVVKLPSLIAMKGGDLEGEIQTARIKMKGIHIETVNLSFVGSVEAGLEEKKLVIVEF